MAGLPIGAGRLRNRVIPGLDGLRAIAVIAVVAYHIFPGLLPGGFIGVDIFFVISGFLITTLLMQERARSGRIAFLKFWMRRARRLLPVLCVAIGVASSLALFARSDLLVGLDRQILGAATFSSNWLEILAGANYFNALHPHLFATFWSLAVEEQFYAVWPLLLAVLLGAASLAHRLKIGAAISLMIAGLSALLMALWFQETNPTRVYYGTDTHIFGLMIGAALAFWRSGKYISTQYERADVPFGPSWMHFLGWPALCGLGVLMMILPEQSPFAYRGGLLVASVLAAVVIVAAVGAPGRLRQLLARPSLVWLGKRSYGIYIWHWPLLVLAPAILPVGTPPWIASVVTVAVTLGMAAWCYRYVELPIRTLGLGVYVRRSLGRQVTPDIWKFRPRPIAIASTLCVLFTAAAIAQAPAKTQAQQQVEAGQEALARAQAAPSKTAPVVKSEVVPAKPPITGPHMTLIGDSVALASVPSLEVRFPGIYIDAKISRSLRRGGFEAVGDISAMGNLRQVVIVALGTNGPYGEGNLEKLIAQLGERDIILVTSHGTVPWIADNNTYVRRVAPQYSHVAVAEWDGAIAAHPEHLASDSTHPSRTGGDIYAASIAEAAARLRQ